MVYNGNVIKPSEAVKEPNIKFNTKIKLLDKVFLSKLFKLHFLFLQETIVFQNNF